MGIFNISCLLFPRGNCSQGGTVPKGEQEDNVSASLLRSHLWQHVTILRFHINMRVMVTNSEDQREFAKWVLNVGDGDLPTIAEEEGVDPD